MSNDKIICHCCGKEARWCVEGEGACGCLGCADIHCDHCKMHYTSDALTVSAAESIDKAKAAMLLVYLGQSDE